MKKDSAESLCVTVTSPVAQSAVECEQDWQMWWKQWEPVKWCVVLWAACGVALSDGLLEWTQTWFQACIRLPIKSVRLQRVSMCVCLTWHDLDTVFLSRVHVCLRVKKCVCVCGSFWMAVDMFVWVGLCEWVKQPVLLLGLEVDLTGPVCVLARVHNVSKRTSWRCRCVHGCFRKPTWCICACVCTYVCLMRLSKCCAGQIAFTLACRVPFVSGPWWGPLCVTDLVFRCRPPTAPPPPHREVKYFSTLLYGPATDRQPGAYLDSKRLHGWLDRRKDII